MKKKIYSSFEEIDRDLEIIDLERKLHYHKMIGSVQNLRKNLSFGNIAKGMLGLEQLDDKPLIKSLLKIGGSILLGKAFGFLKK